MKRKINVVYTLNKKGECFNDDYSSRFKILIIGPLNPTNLFNKTYNISQKKAIQKKNIDLISLIFWM